MNFIYIYLFIYSFIIDIYYLLELSSGGSMVAKLAVFGFRGKYGCKASSLWDPGEVWLQSWNNLGSGEV